MGLNYEVNDVKPRRRPKTKVVNKIWQLRHT